MKEVVDSHEQKYKLSCSPSLIEMMLKIHGLVDSKYYDLQEKYKNENVGLTHFRNQEIEGLHIHSHDESSGQSFLDRLQELTKAGHVVALYCKNPNDENFHGWLVDEILESEDKISLLTKLSELGSGEGRRTIQYRFPLSGSNSIQITDLIYGTTSSE